MRLVALSFALAMAHPLGNFSVNQYAALTVQPDGVHVVAVVNTAEIPTRQDESTVDSSGDGRASDPERAAFAARTCAGFAAAFSVTVGGRPLQWTVQPGSYEYEPGAGGLPTARLSCTLDSAIRIDSTVPITVVNGYRGDRIGWHELTATGVGVRLDGSRLPTQSLTRELREYPNVAAPTDLVDVRTASFTAVPGASGSSSTVAAPVLRQGALARITAWTERRFEGLAADRLLPLAFLLALLLGAGHAALPGHGKTVLAAYLAGRQGRPRDAIAVGGIVTLTHTVGVLVLGLLLTTSTALAGDRVIRYLGVASGILIVGIGGTMVFRAVRHARQHRLGHSHSHPHEHREEHGHGHSHGGRLGLAGMGIAGGLVPSPSALVVLLAAIGLGRAPFGVLLVIAYGIGMAATLTAAGLLLLAVQRRLSRTGGRFGRLAAVLPRVTPLAMATLVVLVGLGLTARSVIG